MGSRLSLPSVTIKKKMQRLPPTPHSLAMRKVKGLGDVSPSSSPERQGCAGLDPSSAAQGRGLGRIA